MIFNNDLIMNYHKYFQQWDTVSAVRSKPNRYQLSKEDIAKQLQTQHWFLPTAVPILTHSLLKNIDADQHQYVLGRFLLQFLEYGTLMEHEFVNTILAELALGEWGIDLPDPMRIDAFRIYTDEAYHATFNLEATQQIRNYLNLPTADAWPLKNSRLEGLRKLIPHNKSKENFLIRFGIAAVSETIAAKELAENMKGIVIDSIYHIFIDHAEDEKKHCMYFSVLFEWVWHQLSWNEKLYLGTHLPKILKAFVNINTLALYEALEKIDVTQEKAKVIISESYPADFSVQRAYSVAAVTFRLFTRLGLFSTPEIHQAFIDEGFFEVKP